MLVSVICPIFNEKKFIAQFLDDIIRQDFSKKDWEVFLVDGMSDDGTRDVIEQYVNRCPYLFLIDNTKRTAPTALNHGIGLAKGDVIVRMDAHAHYPSNYVSTLVSALVRLNADNVGAVCRTIPADNSSVSLVIAKAMSNRFGVGNSFFRIGSEIERKVDTVPFGCFRKDVFSRFGLFDEEMVRCQDNELNGRICLHQGSVFLIPSISFDYYARDSFAKLWKLFYQYGLYKPLVARKLGRPATRRQLVPPLFVLVLIGGAVVGALNSLVGLFWMSFVILYVGTSYHFARKEQMTLFKTVGLMWAFFLMHISYGVGYILGIGAQLLKCELPKSISR